MFSLSTYFEPSTGCFGDSNTSAGNPDVDLPFFFWPWSRFLLNIMFVFLPICPYNSRQNRYPLIVTFLWFTTVLRVLIRVDPHSVGCPRSGSVLGMRIRIQEHENLLKLTNKLGFLPFKGAFAPSYVCFLAYYLYFQYPIFFNVKIQLLWF